MSSELIQLYTWLLGENIEPYADFVTPVNLRMIKEAQEGSEKMRQAFIRKVRLKRVHLNDAQTDLNSPAIKPSTETEEEKQVVVTFKTVEECDQFHNFLSFCNVFLQDNNGASLCALALSYLVKSESLAFPEGQAKVAALFTQFIELDEEQALCLYKNSNFAQNFPATTLLVNAKTVTHEMKRLEGLQKRCLWLYPSLPGCL
jgi:hypothetical protein